MNQIIRKNSVPANVQTHNPLQNGIRHSYGALHIVRKASHAPETIPLCPHDAQGRCIGDVCHEVYIGRSRLQNTHAIDDKSISRQHAILMRRQHTLYVRDCGSLLGTFHNGRRVQTDEDVPLNYGDLVGFGRLLYRYQPDEREQAHHRIAHVPNKQTHTHETSLDDRVAAPDLASRHQARMVLAKVLNHNSKLQFFGYNFGNLLLALHQMAVDGSTHYGANLETYAAIVLLIGSICAWRFEPSKRPYMLLYNGLLIVVGGILFYRAGYPMTGMAMVVASLEVARGGLAKLETVTLKELYKRRETSWLNSVSQGGGEFLLAWYILLIEAVTSKFQGVGRFINERPFITGPCIQLPVRIGFIGTMGMIGNWAGVAAGLSWVLLGDGGLALHDAQFKSFVLKRVLRVVS